MSDITFERKNSDDETLRARFVRPANNKEKIPLVLMLTGDGPSGSNSLSWVKLPPRLAELGIATLLFDFSGLGNSEGDRRKLTLTKGISDFRIIFNALETFKWVDFDNLGIMASSFGACAAILCPDILNKAKAIGFKSPCCFLPDAYVNEISAKEFDDWIENGHSEANGYDFNVLLDPFKYNTYAEASKVNSRCLITHGINDEIIPVVQSKYLEYLLSGPKELILLNDCDHGYSGGKWEEMAKIFIDYYSKYLLI